MEALVLEKKDKLSLRDINVPETLGPHDVRISINTVGICGSDVHYYTHGAIGPFVVKEPMVLGHEAAGVVDAAVQLHGGAGYLRDTLVERLYRDAPLLCIGEGTNELQRIIIAKQLIKRNPA